MNVTTCVLSPTIQTLFICVILVGLIAGLALVLLILFVERIGMQGPRQRVNVAAQARDLQQALDDADERITCWACWEGRHAGQYYPFSGSHLCREHEALFESTDRVWLVHDEVYYAEARA